ncbi:hypothetical protein RirG_112870 [Rhizophagus irregularis DAOM 197198w]|uniref:Uncharacterized protein n=1 Tax=Rhizophagus irregularis (strain DAOM 197198w) TaxID=1432141 RepID=A0A015ML87_RHIIW|nr:hypothetical protein RirG_112870 [Rhizophagus irregularis DAOM 197198w]
MPSGYEKSESIESCRKRLAREKQASLRERRKINDENRHPDHTEQEVNETPEIRKKRLAKERQASLRKK